LARGSRLVEVLKQGQYEPLPVERQILIIYAATNGYVDHLPETAVRKYEADLYRFLDSRHPELLEQLRTKRQFDDDLKKLTNKVLDEFKEVFTV